VTSLTTSVPMVGPGGPLSVVVPNPFRETTDVRLTLPRAEALTVTVHDGAGRLVRALVRDARFEPGIRSIAWDGRDDAGAEVRSGVYFCRVTSERGTRMTPMVLRR
jgi:flagellar hook assembly protein FlgD